jgi:signal transduction histidine kinase
MTDLTPDQVMVLQSTWNAALAAMTLGILWNARSPSVYFWCLSGLLGSAFSLLSIGPLADLTYPTYWGQTLLGSVLVTGASMKVAAIGLMTPGVKLRRPVVTGLMMLASLTLFPLMGVSRAITSFLIILYLSALLFWLVQQVFQLGKRLSVTNGKLFAVLIAFQAILIFLIASVEVMAGKDPLVPVTQPLPVGTVAYSMVISLVNTGLFIALILDLNIRQREALRRDLAKAEIARSRLEERQELLADMHDGFGSQLITAKLQAEKGELNQQQLVDLLRECMTDLHLVLEGSQNQNGDLAGALTRYRHRIDRRLAEHHVLLLWRIDLEGAPSLSPNATTNLLRIIQEAINNALKHAAARKIVVCARYSPTSGITIEIEDDGRGMPGEASLSQGLENMHRRAIQLGANLRVRTREEGTGTVVELSNLRGTN